jgi:hypothetical protein
MYCMVGGEDVCKPLVRHVWLMGESPWPSGSEIVRVDRAFPMALAARAAFRGREGHDHGELDDT